TAAAIAGGAVGLVQTKYVYLFGLTAPWAIARTLESLAAKRRMRALAAAAVALLAAQRTYAGLRAAPTAVSPGAAAFPRVGRRCRSRWRRAAATGRSTSRARRRGCGIGCCTRTAAGWRAFV